VEFRVKFPVNLSSFLLAAGATSVLLGAVPSAYAQSTGGDAARAKNKISMCIGCHGIAGYRTAYPEVYNVPLIGGQSEGYLVSALKAYRSGERAHPSMRAIAGSLSDGDMADLAAYYANAKPSK
jgi:cytochrome c553